jgi:hypothetical protein
MSEEKERDVRDMREKMETGDHFNGIGKIQHTNSQFYPASN